MKHLRSDEYDNEIVDLVGEHETEGDPLPNSVGERTLFSLFERHSPRYIDTQPLTHPVGQRDCPVEYDTEIVNLVSEDTTDDDSLPNPTRERTLLLCLNVSLLTTSTRSLCLIRPWNVNTLLVPPSAIQVAPRLWTWSMSV